MKQAISKLSTIKVILVNLEHQMITSKVTIKMIDEIHKKLDEAIVIIDTKIKTLPVKNN
jgi:urocanate hydratase